MSKRVLLAGLFHETHTFLDGRTALADFAVRTGEELFAATGDGSPLAGALDVADSAGWVVVPAIDLRAAPGPIVADEVVKRFSAALKAAVHADAARGLDGVFLVLHGAMVSESLDDVEGEILARVRGAVGPHVPICGVLDLHANMTPAMARHADGLIAYRENPHTDAFAAARRGAELLDRLMRSGERPKTVWMHPPLMWPPTGTGTAFEPMRSLEQWARNVEAAFPEIAAVNVLSGFSFADTLETGVSFSAVTFGDQAVAQTHIAALAAEALRLRHAGDVRETPLDQVLCRLRDHTTGPIVLAEPSDNIGGGAPGDGAALLKALVEHRVENAAVALNDPAAVVWLSALRPGDRAVLDLGGRGSRLCGGPARLDVELVSIGAGQFDLEDRQSHLASMCGSRFDMGPCAVVRCGGIRILLTTHKTPPFDLGQWRSQGIVPETLFVIGVKAAVAHRRAYDPIARAHYLVETPGPCSSNLKLLPYRKLRRPIFPLDE